MKYFVLVNFVTALIKREREGKNKDIEKKKLYGERESVRDRESERYSTCTTNCV